MRQLHLAIHAEFSLAASRHWLCGKSHRCGQGGSCIPLTSFPSIKRCSTEPSPVQRLVPLSVRRRHNSRNPYGSFDAAQYTVPTTSFSRSTSNNARTSRDPLGARHASRVPLVILSKADLLRTQGNKVRGCQAGRPMSEADAGKRRSPANESTAPCQRRFRERRSRASIAASQNRH